MKLDERRWGKLKTELQKERIKEIMRRAEAIEKSLGTPEGPTLFKRKQIWPLIAVEALLAAVILWIFIVNPSGWVWGA